jgi:hypothetical protein
MRLAVNGASVYNLPDSGVDANMFAREIVCACVLFSHVLAVQIPSLELGALCEIVGSRHDLSTRSTRFRVNFPSPYSRRKKGVCRCLAAAGLDLQKGKGPRYIVRWKNKSLTLLNGRK